MTSEQARKLTEKAEKARLRYGRLYKAAHKADNVYQHRLKMAYGKRAGDMRYMPESKRSPEINRASQRYQRAVKAMHDSYADWKRLNAEAFAAWKKA